MTASVFAKIRAAEKYYNSLDGYDPLGLRTNYSIPFFLEPQEDIFKEIEREFYGRYGDLSKTERQLMISYLCGDYQRSQVSALSNYRCAVSRKPYSRKRQAFIDKAWGFTMRAKDDAELITRVAKNQLKDIYFGLCIELARFRRRLAVLEDFPVKHALIDEIERAVETGDYERAAKLRNELFLSSTETNSK